MCWIYILLIIVIAIFAYIMIFKQKQENFNEQSGRLCTTCSGRTFNQCTQCFNCLWIVDKFGQGACVGGDVASGPYNNEQYAMYYTGDPLPTMKYMNDNYKCSYGPMQGNRVIGVNPYDDMECGNKNYGCNRLSAPINKIVNANPWYNMEMDNRRYRSNENVSTNKLVSI